MHKLTAIEAQRVLAVIQEGLDGLNFLSYVPTSPEPQILEHMASSGFGELTGCLQKQWQLEEGLVSVTNTSHSNSHSTHGSSKSAGTSTSLEDLQGQLHHATRGLTRELRRAPDAVKILQGVFHEDRTEEFLFFLQKLAELKGVMYRRLAMTVEEDLHNSTLLRELTERRKHAQDELETLQRNLANERREKERATSSLERTLTKLQNELAELAQDTNIQMETIQRDMKAQVDKSTSEYEAKRAELLNRINTLIPEMAKAAEEHKQAEAVLRKKRANPEKELAAIIETYDQTMREKQEEITKLQAVIEEEGKELQELQEYFDRIEGNEEQIRLEERILAEVKRREMQAVGRMNYGATQIQKLVRGRKLRLEYAKLRAKMKKGGKGKGKGGKKK